MSKIKNGGLDQYGAGPFEQQQFGTAGVEGVKTISNHDLKSDAFVSIHKRRTLAQTVIRGSGGAKNFHWGVIAQEV